MDLVKVRKVGNSSVITLPRSIVDQYPAGTRVVIQALENGDVLITRPESYEAAIQESGRRVVQQHRGLLDRLGAHEPREVPQGALTHRQTQTEKGVEDGHE